MSRPGAAAGIGAEVDARLERMFATERRRWQLVDEDLAPPLDALRDYAMAGGKRLRPAFCFWAFVGAGGRADDPAVVDAGAALEMLHTAALVHDDIIDRSSRRHGADTVHVRFAALHDRHGWSGDGPHFGEGAAILIGDLALVYSSQLVAGAPRAAIAVFEDMRVEVNVGQYLDVLGTAQGMPSDGTGGADRARRICRYKTAKYTIERPLHIGAALADPDGWDSLAAPLSEFGLPLGEAFQLKDDLLGVFGDETVTGKPVGDDLREGKPTLLAGLAAARHPGFAERFGAPDLTPDDVADLQGIIESTGARTEVEDAMARLIEKSEAALAALPLRPEALQALSELARFVAGRDR